MGTIRDLALEYWDQQYGNWSTPNRRNWYDLFTRIDSKIEELRTQRGRDFDKFFATLRDRLREQDKRIDGLSEEVTHWAKTSRSYNTRLKALEGQVELNHINLETLNKHIGELWEKPVRPALFTVTEPTVKEPLPYDKDGKPEGELKPRDVVSYRIHYPGNPKFHNRKCFGQFHHKDDDKIWGYWQSWKTRELDKDLTFVYQDRITFEFRPRFPDQEKS